MKIKYPKCRYLDGLYFKIYRNNKWENICMSDMDDNEKRLAIKNLHTRTELENAIFHLTSVLNMIGNQFDIIGKYYDYSSAQGLTDDQFVSNMIDKVLDIHEKSSKSDDNKYIVSKFGTQYKRTNLEDIRSEFDIKDPLLKRKNKMDLENKRKEKLSKLNSQKPKRKRNY